MTMFATSAVAQDTPQPEKTQYLPTQGELQIGFGLNPLTRYIGSFLTAGNDLDNLAGDPLIDDQTFSGAAVPALVSIMGSYMVTDNLGIRCNLGVNYNSTRRRYEVPDQLAIAQDPLCKDFVTDIKSTQKLNLSLSAGVEYRFGENRFQGIFGGGLIYGANVLEKVSYTYGNAITEANQVPEVAGAMPGYDVVSSYEYIPQARKLSGYADKGTHYIGAYGSVGVEWFVTPKVSLGANVNVILDYAFQPSYMEVYEGWNVQTMSYEKFYKQGELLQDSFTFTTDNIGSNLYISFFF